ncbi:unnamed protein product [Arctia plantaginis]|uniref:Uncharacterized protein n=1 Tax=Arctia plantaginis TaxID=874455 RepID=A0A8S0ZGS7_ARCPL|nr:unnamed protein product [Arctia plantaginis]
MVYEQARSSMLLGGREGVRAATAISIGATLPPKARPIPGTQKTLGAVIARASGRNAHARAASGKAREKLRER